MKLKYIDIQGYSILVDENAEIKTNDYFLHNTLADTSIHKCIGRPAKQSVIGDNNIDYFLGWCSKIIFAEKELNLYCDGVKKEGESCNKNNLCTFPNCKGVYILPNWREWRDNIENNSKIHSLVQDVITKEGRYWNDQDALEPVYYGFIAGYNYNKAKYTDEDLKEFGELVCWNIVGKTVTESLIKDLVKKVIQMFQKYPKYIVMESEIVKGKYIGRVKMGITPAGEPTYINEGYEEIQQPKLTTNSEGKQVGIIKEIIY